MRNCIDCDKKISRASKLGRCKSCSRKGELNHYWRNGVSLPCDCFVCGIPLNKTGIHTTKMCRLCFLKDPVRRQRVSITHKLLVKIGKNHFGDGTKTPRNAKIRQSKNYSDWVKEILLRDDYTCQICKIRGGKLTVDHIKPFYQIINSNNVQTLEDAIKCSELWDKANGRVLCRPCHKQTPTWGFKTWNLIRAQAQIQELIVK